MEIRGELEQALARAVDEGTRAEETDDAFGSYIAAGKRQRLEAVLARWDAGIGAAALLEELKAERRHLRELEEQEEHHPTFDWASDHYWACIYAGERYGCEAAIRILEGNVGQ